ncbi:sigma-70 family RNA polymerase sigma factor [Oceanithermus sp.]
MAAKKPPTKTDRIRELYLSGKSISEIAKELGIRYQHAYNVLVSSGLHKPKSKKGEPPKVDPKAYAEFIRGLDLRAVLLEQIEAQVKARPEGRLGFEIRLTPADEHPMLMDGGFSAALHFEVEFLVQEKEGGKERSFGYIQAVWRGVYSSREKPSKTIYNLFIHQNLPVNLWPYFRVQVDQLTAQMGLPRLVLPAFKTVR